MTASQTERMKWAEGPLLSFDSESTGVDVWSDRIVTASVVEIRSGRRPTSTTWLVNPGVDIPAEATAVHGITTEHAAEHGRPPAEVLFEVTGGLALAMNRKIPVVGFNLAYDLTLLEAENRRHGQPTLAERLGGVHRIGPCVDTMVLDKYVDGYRTGRCDGRQRRGPKCTCGADGKKLVDLCRHYGVLLGDAHTADADALAAARLWPRMIARHEKKLDMPLPMLHQQQTVWRRQQMDSLRAYFDRQGTVHDGCCGSWPVHTGDCCAPSEAVAS